MSAAWLHAFLLTLLIEAPIALYGFRSIPIGRRVAAFLIANGMSHPLLWFVFPRFEPYGLWVVVAESAVVVFEAGVYFFAFSKGIRFARVLAVSFFANLVSCLVGLVFILTGT